MQKSMIKLLSLADIVSLTNAGFGFLAIIMASLGEMWFSFSFILIALLADGLDGIVARKTGHSELGNHMEAMAKSFGGIWNKKEKVWELSYKAVLALGLENRMILPTQDFSNIRKKGDQISNL